MNKSICLLFFVWVGVVLAEDYSKETRQLESYRVEGSPIIDGKLDDDAWKGAVKTDDFRKLGGKGISKSKTEVMTCWDANNLYLAYLCHEPKMELLAENYPGYQGPFRWSSSTDEMELFIQPFKDNAYFHFTASAAAELYHRFSYAPKTDKQYRWNVEVKTAKLKDRWQAELAIPFTELKYTSEGHHFGLTPSDGDRWHITFARFSVPVGEEWSSWNAGTFHRKGPLGEIIFKDRRPHPKLKPETEMVRTVGKKMFHFEIENPSDKTLKVAVRLDLNGTSSDTEFELAPQSKQKEAIPYQILSAGDVMLSFVASINGQPFKKGSILHRVEGTKAKLEAAHTTAQSYLKELPENRELQKFRKDAASLIEKWDNAGNNPDSLSTNQWLQISKASLTLLEGKEALFERASKLVSRKRLSAFWGNRIEGELEYAAGVEDNMTKLRQEDAFLGQVTDQVSLTLARNEYEGAQVVLIPLTKDLKDVRFVVNDLESPAGKRISAKQVRVRPVGYVDVNPIDGVARRPRKPGGLWPDALMELETFNCEKEKLQPVWIDVFASEDQPSGIYQGNIRILPANSHPLNLSLKVRIWDFELPKQNSLKIDYWFWSGPGSIELYYKTKFTLEDFKRYARFMGSYRLPLAPHTSHLWGADLLKIHKEKDGTYTIDFSDYDPYLKIAVENGMNVYHLPGVVRHYKGHIVYWERTSGERKSEKLGAEEAEKIWTALMVQTWEHLKELKWFDEKIAVFYEFDETQPRGKTYERLKVVHAKVKELAPGLRRTFAMNTLSVEAFRDHVEIFIPVIERIKPETIQDLQRDGFDVWWYTMGYAQWPDYHANQDSVDHRIIMWMNWKYGVTGILRWALNRWGAFYSNKPWCEFTVTDDPAKRWPNTPWKTTNSSTYLFYPGPNGNPWASIRMENHRDGVEDYEYFVLLKRLIDGLKEEDLNDAARKEIKEARTLLEIPKEIVQSRSDYARKPETFDTYRQRLGNTIERLSPLTR